jgi:hypothetical protein
MQVIYVGQLWVGSTTLERAKSLAKHGWQLTKFDITPYMKSGSRLMRSLQHRLLNGPDVWRFNKDLLNFCNRHGRANIVWIDKGTWLFASTLERIKERTGALLVHYTPDPAFVVHTSRHFRKGLAIYDFCVTTKRYEMDAYHKAGAKKTIFNLQGIDDRFLSCTQCSDIDNTMRNGVVFIGRREPHYQNLLMELAVNGVKPRIWGPGWEHLKKTHNLLSSCIISDGVWGSEYPRALALGSIGMGFLSKMYPDAFTTRTFEVPAAGCMLLAERTQEHLELFEEDKEAVFFSTKVEMVDKVLYYLKNEKARSEIARRGHEKTINEYTWSKIMKPSIDAVHDLLSDLK